MLELAGMSLIRYERLNQGQEYFIVAKDLTQDIRYPVASGIIGPPLSNELGWYFGRGLMLKQNVFLLGGSGLDFISCQSEDYGLTWGCRYIG